MELVVPLSKSDRDALQAVAVRFGVEAEQLAAQFIQCGLDHAEKQAQRKEQEKENPAG